MENYDYNNSLERIMKAIRIYESKEVIKKYLKLKRKEAVSEYYTLKGAENSTKLAIAALEKELIKFRRKDAHTFLNYSVGDNEEEIVAKINENIKSLKVYLTDLKIRITANNFETDVQDYLALNNEKEVTQYNMLIDKKIELLGKINKSYNEYLSR